MRGRTEGGILQSCYARPTCDAELAEVRTTAARHRDHPLRPAGRRRPVGGGRMADRGARAAAGGVGRRRLRGAAPGGGAPRQPRRRRPDRPDAGRPARPPVGRGDPLDGRVGGARRGSRGGGRGPGRGQPVLHRRLHPCAGGGARLLGGGAARHPWRAVRAGRRVPVLRMDLDRVGRRRDVRAGRGGPRRAGRPGGARDVNVPTWLSDEIKYLVYRTMSWLGPALPTRAGRTFYEAAGRLAYRV